MTAKDRRVLEVRSQIIRIQSERKMLRNTPSGWELDALMEADINTLKAELRELEK